MPHIKYLFVPHQLSNTVSVHNCTSDGMFQRIVGIELALSTQDTALLG
jgi:hypothetical protein